MSTNLEIEYKSLLSLAEYDQLKKLFTHITPVRQTNHYLDSKDFKLRKKKLALRIRTFDKSAEMTLKVPQEVGNIEYNIALTLEEAQQLLGERNIICGDTDLSEICELLTARDINLEEITLIGSLTTIRYEQQLPIGLAALDKNDYLGHTDYELELEVEDNTQGKKDFFDFLEKNRVEYRFSKSKVVRFLDCLRHLRK
ncbi:CYTH domain-containing protein [Lactococcus allomyrinae]|uniref:CYTH domain-containing protein n=1 Tax=Lactococcus allomyrinae TaxID=2419773 RepID=A0A387BCZ2_9LACT|nr:CYTH domain-containing protein [Lactococcus allomyrinae]AYG01765.1 CYTH domain-containing protein [Lactococcus allomyrinae]